LDDRKNDTITIHVLRIHFEGMGREIK
jgi:hypothetical protein